MTALRVLLAVFVAGATFACSIGTSKTCTLVGCGGIAGVAVATDRPLPELAGGLVRLCRDGVCSESAIRDPGTGLVGCDGSGPSCGVVNGSQLTVWFAPTAPDGGAPRDGEAIEIVVLAPDGTTSGSRTGTLRITRSRPNGPDCEPECVDGRIE